MKKNLLYPISAALIATLIISCSNSSAPTEEKQEVDIEVTEAQAELNEEDHVDEASQSDEPSKQSATAALKTQFTAGSWEWELIEFIESEDMMKVFELDQVPFDGEELPAEAVIQLDNLAEIHSNFPFLKIEVQAHTTAAKNELGKKTKMAASKARALWVSTKLKLRDVPKEQLSSKGMGDTELLKDLEPDDKAQRRIMAVISK